MTTNPKAARYHIRRVERPAAPTEGGSSAGVFDTEEDGFGNMDFRRPEDRPAPGPQVDDPVSTAGEDIAENAATDIGAPGVQPPAAKAETPQQIEAALSAIAAEGLTGRQLRRALLIAQKHQITPKSEYDAVRLLREAGIDPFSRASMLRIVSSEVDVPPVEPAMSRESSRELTRLPGDTVQLPKRVKPVSLPSTEQRAEVNQAAEILRMQQDIARRRRRRP